MPLSRKDFKIIKKLAIGRVGGMNQGIVLVRNRRNNLICIEKRVDVEAVRLGHAGREIKAMKLCSHRNICAILAADLDYYGCGYGSLFIERCELGSLRSIVERFALRRRAFPEGFLWKVLWDIGIAICYLQTGVDAGEKAKLGIPVVKGDVNPGWNRILHRDIKPDNILLTFRDSVSQYPTIVLADFGCSITRDDIYSRHMSAFTPSFMPPEAPEFTDASDIYSLALSIHCMAQLRILPFSDSERLQNDPLGAASFSKVLGTLLKRCLSTNFQDRPDGMYLPYLVWRDMLKAKKEVEGDPKVSGTLPDWAFEKGD